MHALGQSSKTGLSEPRLSAVIVSNPIKNMKKRSDGSPRITGPVTA